MHFELHSATNALLVAPPVAGHRERVYQVFGRETLDQLIPLAAVQPLERVGLPQPPPWRRSAETAARESDAIGPGGRPTVGTEDAETRTGVSALHDFGEVRLHGFVSKPEIRSSTAIRFYFCERTADSRSTHSARDHGGVSKYFAATVFPVVLLFMEMPTAEVDVNVHPSKTEVRFRQQTVIHDFVRESVRAALMKARPVPQFLTEIGAQPTASRGLTSPRLLTARAGAMAGACSLRDLYEPRLRADSRCTRRRFQRPRRAFEFEGGIAIEANAAVSLARAPAADGTQSGSAEQPIPDHGCAPPIAQEPQAAPTLESLRTLRPLARFEIPSFLPSTKMGSGSSISMWRTSACCSNAFCGNVRRRRWRANACSCRW